MLTDLPPDQAGPNSAVGSAEFIVDPRRVLLIIFIACVASEILFFLLDLFVNYQHGASSRPIRRIFNTAREGSLPSWFGVTQTFIIGVVAFINFFLVRKIDASALRRVGWLILAIVFVYLSADDDAKIHERVGTASKSLAITKSAVGAYPSYAWQVVFGPIFGAIGLFMLYFLWKELPRRFDRFLVLSAMGCLILSQGLDFVEGLDDGYEWLIDTFDWKKGVVEHFSKSIEETLEMFGMTLFLIAFLGQSMRLRASIAIKFR